MADPIVDVTVADRVGLVARGIGSPAWAKVIGELTGAFTHENPDYWKAKRFGFKGKVPKQIVTLSTAGSGNAFSLLAPRGGFNDVRRILREHGIGTRIEDRRSEGRADLRGRIPAHRVQLYEDQVPLLEAVLLHETALIRSPTASGKTTIALAAIAAANLPTLVVVANARLQAQWIKRCEKELGIPEREVGRIDGKVKRVAPITIAMEQSLANHAEEYRDAFGFVLCDEVQKAAATRLFAIVDQMPARYRVGVSDDERRADRKEFLIHDLFGEPVASGNYKQLVADGRILDVAIQVIPTSFDAAWYHTLSDEQRALAFQKLLDEMQEDEERNAVIAGCASVACREDGQCLVMTHRREHAMTLDRLITERGHRCGFILGGDADKDEADRTSERLKEGKVDAAVGTYQAVGTGIDLPRLGRGVFATPCANGANGKMQFKQYRGRFARAADGKTDAAITYLYDRLLFGAGPLRNLCRWSARVTVMWRGEWRPGKEVLKEIENEEQERSSAAGFGF